MAAYPEMAERTNAALAAGGLHYDPGSLRIRHLLDVIVDDVGLEALAAKVTRPLHGLRLAPYYGCLIVRPPLNGDRAADGANPEYPTHLDRLLRKLGAEVVDYPLKTHCCGGHMTQISAETAYELIRRLLQMRRSEYEADCIVTVCPMCQLNLDAYQSQVNRHFGTDFRLPVLYFTQMIGLALGLRRGRPRPRPGDRVGRAGAGQDRRGRARAGDGRPATKARRRRRCPCRAGVGRTER